MDHKLFLSSVIIATGLVVLAVPQARAADATTELATATAHAGMAAAAGELKMVHAHLHHVVNCLVGPGAPDYDAAQADPCKGQGMGVIPDTAADKRGPLGAAVGMAKQGIAQDDLTKAKADAAALQAALKKASM
ncbi:MAG: hypothetical protein EPN20_16030 [Magnetospirillum sp.]|nr:MAG: hypothetical protein EPN20_16030 [Magnetospirillum sp.]